MSDDKTEDKDSPVGSGGQVEQMVIFEAVDSTDDERYYTLGLWLTLEEAIKAITLCNAPSDFTDQDHEGICIVEIRERPIGWSSNVVRKARIEWTEEYNEKKDEYTWKWNVTTKLSGPGH